MPRFGMPNAASILAELGDLKEADRLAEDALGRIRVRLTPFSVGYDLLSQEGWVMLLLRAIKLNQWSLNGELEASYRDRWSKLDAHRCNPGPEIELLESVVSGPSPQPDPARQWRKGFDPGRSDLTHHFSSGLLVADSGLKLSDISPALAFLRLFEEGAIPMRCGMVTMYPEAVLRSAEWVFAVNTRWSLCCMLRTGKTDEVSERFTRNRVATLTQVHVTQFASVLVPALAQAIQASETRHQPKLLETGLSERLLHLLPEML